MIARPSFVQTPPRFAAAAVLSALLFASLPLAFSLPVAVTVLFALLWLVRAVLLLRDAGRLPVVVLALLAVGSAALVWSQLGTVFGREGGISLLLLLVALKSFEASKSRDWKVLLLSVLFLTGTSVLFDQGLSAGLWMVAALTASAVCLALVDGAPLREAVRQSLWALAAVLPLAAVLFVSVPRLSGPLWRIPQSQQDSAKTGLSDTMQPGSISNLVQSDEWVADIVFSDGIRPEAHQLYWRAIIMDAFDGERWQATGAGLTDSARPVADGGTAYQIVVRDHHGALPALDQPAGRLPSGLSVRLGNTVRADAPREGLRRLNLSATLRDTLPQALSDAEYAHYTRLPESGNLQTRLLAERLAKQSSDERAFVQNVLQHYRRGRFAYTLRPQPAPGRDGIDTFMFQTRQGFCEHYAQSFVVMMRAAGLPARVVTGYLGGSYNAGAGFWQLRAKDAHAWAEVWLPSEKAWLRVDPTAAVSSQRIDNGIGGALPAAERDMVSDGQNRWTHWLDTGRFYWQQWVAGYDQSRQNSLFAKLGLGGFNLKTLLLFLPAALLLSLLPLWKWWQSAAGRERDLLEEGYSRIRDVLCGSGSHPVSSGELLEMLRDSGIRDPELETLLQQHGHWLYAAAKPGKAAQRRWYRAALKTAKRHARQQSR